MITLDAFLVFLGAALIPVTYILLMSRWIEPEYRRAYPPAKAQKSAPAVESRTTLKPALLGVAK